MQQIHLIATAPANCQDSKFPVNEYKKIIRGLVKRRLSVQGELESLLYPQLAQYF